MADTYKYKAFISYSHNDKKFAKWLHKKIEGYKIPKHLRDKYPDLPEGLKRSIFIDDEELPIASVLSDNISNALDSSEFLIVIGSPNSTSSYWVDKEISYFKQHNVDSNILTVIKDGEPNATHNSIYEDAVEAFPKSLRYKVDSNGMLTNERVVPLAADARQKKDRQKALIKLIAGVLYVNFADLWERDKKERRKRNSIMASLITIFIAMGIFVSYQYIGIKNNNELELINQRIAEIEYTIRNEAISVEKITMLSHKLKKLKIDKDNREASLKALGKLSTSLGEKAKKAYQRNGAKEAISILTSRASLASQESRLKEISREKLALATLYEETYEFKKAEDSYTSAVHIFLDFENSIKFSLFLMNQNHTQKAIDVLERISKDRLSRDEFLSIFVFLNLLYDSLGQYESAKKIKHKIMKIVNVLTPEDIKNINVMNYFFIGMHYEMIGKKKMAIDMLQKAVVAYRKLAQKETMFYVELLQPSLLLLGSIYSEEKQYKKSKDIYTEVLKNSQKIDKKYLDKYNSSIASASNALGNLYYANNEYDQALLSYKNASKIYSKMSIKNPNAYNDKYASTLENIGRTYESKMLYDKALQMYKKALHLMYLYKGEDYNRGTEHLVLLLGSIGLLCQNLKQFSEAEKAYTEALEITHRFSVKYPHSYDNGEYAKVLDRLGFLYHIQGKYSKAEEFYKRGLKVYSTLMQVNADMYRYNLANALYWLGRTYTKDNKLDKAQKTLEKSLQVSDKLPPNQNRHKNEMIGNAFEGLGAIFERKKEFIKSEENYYNASLAYQILYNDDPLMYKNIFLRNLSSLGYAYFFNKKFDNAKEVFINLLTRCKRQSPKNTTFDIFISDTAYILGATYEKQKQYSKAEKYYDEALSIYRDLVEKYPDKYKGYIKSLRKKLNIIKSIGGK